MKLKSQKKNKETKIKLYCCISLFLIPLVLQAWVTAVLSREGFTVPNLRFTHFVPCSFRKRHNTQVSTVMSNSMLNLSLKAAFMRCEWYHFSAHHVCQSYKNCHKLLFGWFMKTDLQDCSTKCMLVMFEIALGYMFGGISWLIIAWIEVTDAFIFVWNISFGVTQSSGLLFTISVRNHD